MALRLILKGYIIRYVFPSFDLALSRCIFHFVYSWANYSKGGFKEGVSLSVDDELNRWQKYSYGCNE